MQIEFSNKNIMITGAAGNLGYSLSKAYSLSGANSLVLLDVQEKLDKLYELAESCKSNGTKVYTYTCDNTNLKDIKRVINEIKNDDIKIDILVNNAGANVLQKVNEVTEEIWDFIVDLNLKGSFFLTQGIGDYSLIERGGNVIFIASQHGVVGNIMRTHYCATKTGIIGLVRALTAEWSKYNVRVNAVSPTYIINSSNAEILNSFEYKRKYLQNIPLKKYATPDDIADAVLFLSSEKASMITGHNLVVDGGYTCI